MPNLPGPPLQTPVIESGREPGTTFGVLTKYFADYLLALSIRAQAVATTALLALTGQTASIGLTPIVPTASGLYRVSWRVRVTTVASVSSSITVTVTSTEGALTCTQSGGALALNDATKPQSGSVLVRADPNTPISVSTTYASVGTAMVYALDVVVEFITQ